MKHFVEHGDIPPAVLCSITSNGPIPPAPDTPNQLAKRLEEYWHDKGYPAERFWTEPVGGRFAKVGTYELYRIGCNLKNGLPPRYRDEAS